MAGYMVVNPRKKRKTTRRKATRRKTTRKRRNPYQMTAANPRRRARRKTTIRRYTRRRNPRPNFFGLGRIDFEGATAVAGGAVATNMAGDWLLNMLPADWKAGQAADLTRVGSKLAVGVVLPGVLSRFIGAKWSKNLALGGIAAVMIDVFQTWVAPNIPGLSDYEWDSNQLENYESNNALSDYQGSQSGMVYQADSGELGASLYNEGAY